MGDFVHCCVRILMVSTHQIKIGSAGVNVKLTVLSKITNNGKYYLVDGRKLSIRVVLDFGLATKHNNCLVFHYKLKDEPIYLTYKHCIAEALYRWNNLVLSGVE